MNDFRKDYEGYRKYRSEFGISKEELSRMFNLEDKGVKVVSVTDDNRRDMFWFQLEGAKSDMTFPTGETELPRHIDSIELLKNMKKGINDYLDKRIKEYEKY